MANSPGRVARIGPIWASSVACRATVFGGEYGVKYLVVHCAPFGNLRPVVGIAFQEARGRRARGGVGRGAGCRCREVLLDLDGFVEHGIGVVIGGLGSLVGRGCQHVLTDDDHREQAVRLC